MAKKDKKFEKQVKDSLERQKTRMANERANLSRPGSQTAAPENTYTQTDTGEKKAKVDDLNRKAQQNEQRRTSSAKKPIPKGSQTTGGGKTPEGKPGAGSSKPNYSPRRDLGPGKFGNRPPPKTPPQPGVGKVKGTAGTIGAFATGAEAFDAIKQYPEQQEAYAKYGVLAPDETRTDFNPLSRGVDMVAGMFGAEPQLLERTVSRFTDKPFQMNDPSRQRDMMYTYAAAKEGGVELGEVSPEMLENVRGRADLMRSQISEGTFDPATLSEEDAQLARNLGVDLDNLESPTTTRTGIPPKDGVLGTPENPTLDQDYRNISGKEPPVLGGGGLERSDLADTPTDFRDPDDPDVFASIDVAQDADAQVVLEKIQRGEPVGPIEVGIAEQLKQAGQIDGYTQGGTTTAPSYTDTPTFTDTNTDIERPAVGGNDATPPPVGGNESSPNLFRRVGEDGVIEYSDQGGEGFEPVDLNLKRNVKGGFVAAQDSIQDFPGTSAFVQGISTDARRRERDFRRQQRKARVNQARLPQRARSAVYAQNPDLVRAAKKGGLAGGVASNALNEYTLRMAQIMQQGRDAFAPEDFDTTTPVLEADRNDAQYAGIEADLERTQTYRDKNAIDAQKNIADAMFDFADLEQEIGKQGAQEVETYIKRHFPAEDEEGVLNPDIGKFDAFSRQLITGRESPKERSDKLRQAHFLTEVSKLTGGVSLNPSEMLNENFIENILAGKYVDAGISAQKNRTAWQKVKNPVDTVKSAISKDELDSGIIDFKGQTITLGQLLDMAQGYGRMKQGAVDLARVNSERY